MSSGPPPPTAPAVNPAVAAPVSALVAPGGAVPVSVSAPVQNSHNPHNSVTAGATGLSSGVVGVHRDQTKRKEIYKYEAPWTVYSMNWSIRCEVCTAYTAWTGPSGMKYLQHRLVH